MAQQTLISQKTLCIDRSELSSELREKKQMNFATNREKMDAQQSRLHFQPPPAKNAISDENVKNVKMCQVTLLVRYWQKACRADQEYTAMILPLFA